MEKYINVNRDIVIKTDGIANIVSKIYKTNKEHPSVDISVRYYSGVVLDFLQVEFYDWKYFVDCVKSSGMIEINSSGLPRTTALVNSDGIVCCKLNREEEFLSIYYENTKLDIVVKLDNNSLFNTFINNINPTTK